MIPEILARLQDLIPGAAALAADAAALAALAPGVAPATLPALFVVPLRDAAGPPEGLDAAKQRVERAWGVLMVVAADDSGGAMASLEALRRQVEARLFGWQPDPEADPVSLGGGELVSAAGGAVWWQDEYRTVVFKTQPVQP